MLYGILAANPQKPWQKSNPASAPINTVAPQVTGVGYVGYTLTTTTGSWTGIPSPSFTYQWQRNGVDISLATASTYVVTLADEGVPVRCVVTATNIFGITSANSNAIEQWMPTDAGTVDGWWDAFSPATITIATGISQWDSRGSKSGGTLTQINGSDQPEYSATGWDGVRPSANFNGHTVRGPSSPFGRNCPGITFAAAATTPTGSSGSRSMFSVSQGTNSSFARISPREKVGSVFSSAGRRLDEDGLFDPASPVAITSATRIFSSQIDHFNDRHRTNIDGQLSLWATPFRGAGFTSDTDSLAVNIGANPSGVSEKWNGKIAEIVYFDRTLSDNNLDRLNGYLAWRWGVTANLPALHPYKSSPPDAAPVPPVNTVAPVVTGTGYVGYTLSTTDGTWTDSPTFTYQWQRFLSGAWNNISGATSSTYVVTIADEGNPVRCVVIATSTTGVTLAGSNAIEQWIPTDLGADLENWWDAEDASTITIATGVSQWNSKGNLADSVVQGTGTRQPAYSATGWDGTFPAVTFDGTDDYLVRSVNADRCRNQPGYRVAFAFAQGATPSATDNRLYAITNGGGTTRLTSGASNTQFNMGARPLDGDAYAFSAPSAFANDSLRHVRLSRYKFTTGEAQQRIDGTQGSASAAFTSGNTSDTVSTAVSLGAGNTGPQPIGGTLHEIIAVRGEGTDAENEKIEAYLAWRARLVTNLPALHPYKTTAPTP